MRASPPASHGGGRKTKHAPVSARERERERERKRESTFWSAKRGEGEDRVVTGRVGNLLAVLISAGHEKGVTAVVFVVPSDNVGSDAFVSVAAVWVAVGVVDGSRDVVFVANSAPCAVRRRYLRSLENK